MAPTVAVKKPAKGGKKVAKKANKVPNRDLGSGVLRWSRFKINQRRQHRLKNARKAETGKKVSRKVKVAVTVTKDINGAKNGGKRVVQLQKSKKTYATSQKVTGRPTKSCFAKHVRKTRKTLVPGKILILLAGRHKGKRVVLLKVLASGLLLVNGPFSLNACPLRRISQRYVIATKTRVNLKKFVVPEHINDTYFKRASKKRARKTEGDIFAKSEEKYAPSEQRKQDQVVVDKLLKAEIKKHRDGKLIGKYLKSSFALKSHQFPHRMRY